MATEQEIQQSQELSLEEFGEAPIGVPVGVPLEPSVLPTHLKCVPINTTNAYDLTLAVTRAILDAIPFATACMMAGATVEEVATLADEHRPVAMALNYAYAQNIKEWVEKLKTSKDWKAAAFYLERGVPTLFGEARSTGRGALVPTIRDMREARRDKVLDYRNMTDAELIEAAGESVNE